MYAKFIFVKGGFKNNKKIYEYLKEPDSSRNLEKGKLEI